MSQPQSSIPLRQNDPATHALLRAMSVSHRRAQRFAAVRTALSATIAAAGLVATFIDIATPITIIGALWAVIYSVGLASWSDVELRRAAALQEMADVELFGIPWNRLIAPNRIGSEEINQLSKRYRGRDDMITEYYEITDDLRPPYDVLGCQQQNLGWGTRIRRRYAHAVLAGLIAWSAVGIVAGTVADLTIGELLLRWYVPSLGLLLVGVDVFRSQRDVATERERVFRFVRETVTETARRPQTPATDEELLRLARQVQDVPFLTRQRAPRVPDWFFLRFRSTDRADFQAVMAEWQATLARQPAPEPA